MSSNGPIILLAEDDANDVFFFRRALKKAGCDCPLQVVTNGKETVNYLSGSGRYSDRTEFPLPSILLLDLKMPFLDGFEVMTWIRTQPILKDCSVVILTSSGEERDRQRAAELGAKGYFVKPPTPAILREIMGFLSSRKDNTAISA
jgi:CheY-like chemotaxis protein